MNMLRNILLIIVIAALTACASTPDETPLAKTRTDAPPAIAAILKDVEGTEAVTWQQFQDLARWHRTLSKVPPADSKLLLYINERDDKLADALLLYRDHDLDLSIKSAFVQYLTSTPKPVPESAPHPDAAMWAEDYANRLSVAWPPRLGEFGIPYSAPSDLQSLKTALILINRARYGWDEVIPASVHAFRGDEKYTKPNAMWMADMAALAYQDEELVRHQLALWGYQMDSSFRWLDDEDSGTQGFVVRNGSHMVISFRGTKGLRDMKTDLLIRRVSVPWASGGVHRGFSQSLDSVWSDVERAIDDGRGNRQLFVTGHSLGAALAQLAAIRLAHRGDTVTAVYTFGSPFVGNEDFVNAYDAQLASRTFVHINHLDAVTRIPPRWLGFKPVATASTWLFTDAKHAMARLETNSDVFDVEPPAGAAAPETIDLDDPASEDEIRAWFDAAEHDIRVANEFIGVSPDELQSGTYDQQFDSGRVDDHGINQYLFKLGCSILDEGWAEETAKARAN